MSLPNDVAMSISADGIVFELRVASLRQGSEYLFPSQGCVDEFLKSRDLQLAVARAAACALDVAVLRFQKEFQESLSSVLSKSIDVKQEPA